MTLPQSKMPHLLVRLLLFHLLLLLLLPQPSQAASTPKPKPKSEFFWQKFCGFFCPFQSSCDSDVYLSSQQQLDLLNSQKFLDILELFPQILIENEKLQHTTLVRLEDHQRDLILLRYKNFFHPRETLPLARERIISQLARDEQGFAGMPAAEPPPNQIRLTKDQVQRLTKETARLEENQVHQDVPHVGEEEETLGTPDWNKAENFIRDYVNQQRTRQKVEQQTYTRTVKEKEDTTKRRKNDNTITLNINQLQEEALQTNLNIDQIRRELQRMGHSFDLNVLTPKDQDLEDGAKPQPESEPHRTKDPVLYQAAHAKEINRESHHQNSGVDDVSNTANVNRIADKKSVNSREPYPSESHFDRTLQRYFHHHRQNQVPSKRQPTQTLAHLYGISSSGNSLQITDHRRSKRTAEGSNNRPARQRRHRHSHVLVHEPGGIVKEEKTDSGAHQRARRSTRKKREIFKMQVCPAVETWSDLVLAETINGTLVQIAQVSRATCTSPSPGLWVQCHRAAKQPIFCLLYVFHFIALLTVKHSERHACRPLLLANQ